MFTTEETATKSSWWPRRCALAFVRILGWALIALVLDYTIGWTWDEHFGSHDAGPLRAGDRSHIVQPSQAPAMAAEPWSADLRHEFTALEYEYVPYLQTRVGDVAGRYISSSGGVRRSYQVADLPVDVPEVWFFGGGALWGEGQRDLHTIPSEVARLAEWRGEPIRAANFGQPGYTSWQSALLLEQQLAVRPTPDLVVFYDGADDVAVQVEQVEQPMDRPSHYNVRGANVALLGRDSARDQARGWWEDYSGTSVIGRVLDRFERVLGAMPAAASAPDLGARVAVLHRRSVDLASHVASEHGVAVVFAWQAAEGMSGDGELYRRMVAAQEGVESGVVDLSAALDEVPVPVFLDGVLTNERGAREVAAALWRVVRPHVE